MTTRIAINGLGRIGRCVVRALAENNHKDLQLVAVNGTAPTENHVHLLKYDSIHGRFPEIQQTAPDEINFGQGPVAVLHERDPLKLPWKELGIDVVFECTGAFVERDKAASHLKSGAKKVLLSAPGKNADSTIVYGVNQSVIEPNHDVISVGSCTTNCLAPIAKIINDNFGIAHGFMTTIHAYTNDQNITDSSHKDPRRARAAALSMIPTSTGAAKALGLVLPELAGKLDGVAIRVPTPNVSMVDLTFSTEKPISKDSLHALIRANSEGPMRGVLGYTEEPLVSIDFNHSPLSATFDASGTNILSPHFARIAAWYDNEWGFSIRMLDIAKYLRPFLSK
jgi:glyceraldehyde 3-phosphate dehydrogenase